MKEYIDKEDAIDILFAVFASHWKLDCSKVDDMIQRKVVHTKNKIKEVPAADVVEVETLKSWLYEIAMNNVGCHVKDFSTACEVIVSRLDGLILFQKDREVDHET